MTWWMVLLLVVAVIWLLLQIRVGAKGRYGPEGVSAALKIGPFRVQMLPSDASHEKKRKKSAAHQENKEDKPADEKPGTLSRLMKILPIIAEAAGALLRKIRIDDFYLSVVWGAEGDPAAASIGYGRANAAIGMIWPLIDHNFKVKKSAFHVDVDYSAEGPVVVVNAAATLTIGQLLSLAIRYGIKALISWDRSGRSHKQ